MFEAFFCGWNYISKTECFGISYQSAVRGDTVYIYEQISWDILLKTITSKNTFINNFIYVAHSWIG